MIRRTLSIATAVIASVVATACSDATAPTTLGPEAQRSTLLTATHPDAAPRVVVVATITGRGTAEMQLPLPAGKTLFWTGVKGEGNNAIRLLSDGSATGHFTCIDVLGDWPGFPGDINGEVTSWSMEGTVVVLNVVGTVTPFNADGSRGTTRPVSFVVKVQQFGGAGVSRWTLQVGDFIFCYELVTSGRLIYRARGASEPENDE